MRTFSRSRLHCLPLRRRLIAHNGRNLRETDLLCGAASSSPPHRFIVEVEDPPMRGEAEHIGPAFQNAAIRRADPSTGSGQAPKDVHVARLGDDHHQLVRVRGAGADFDEMLSAPVQREGGDAAPGGGKTPIEQIGARGAPEQFGVFVIVGQWHVEVHGCGSGLI